MPRLGLAAPFAQNLMRGHIVAAGHSIGAVNAHCKLIIPCWNGIIAARAVKITVFSTGGCVGIRNKSWSTHSVAPVMAVEINIKCFVRPIP